MYLCTLVTSNEIKKLAPLLVSLRNQKPQPKLLILITDQNPSPKLEQGLKKIYAGIKVEGLNSKRQCDFVPYNLFSQGNLDRVLLSLSEILEQTSDLKDLLVVVPPNLFFKKRLEYEKSDLKTLCKIEAITCNTGSTEYIFIFDRSHQRLAETTKELTRATLRLLRDQKDLTENIFRVLTEVNGDQLNIEYSDRRHGHKGGENSPITFSEKSFRTLSNSTDISYVSKKLEPLEKAKLKKSAHLNSSLSEVNLWNLVADRDSLAFNSQIAQWSFSDTSSHPPPVLAASYRAEKELQQDYGPLMTYDQQRRFLKWGIADCDKSLGLNKDVENIFNFALRSGNLRVGMKSPRSLAPHASLPLGQGISVVTTKDLLEEATGFAQKFVEDRGVAAWPVQIIDVEDLLVLDKFPSLMSHIFFAVNEDILDDLFKKFRYLVSKNYYLVACEVGKWKTAVIYEQMVWIDEFWISAENYEKVERQKILSQVFQVDLKKGFAKFFWNTLNQRLNCYSLWRRV